VRFHDDPTTPTLVQGFDVDAAKRVTSGVDFNHAFFSLMNGATKTLKNCEVHNTWSRTSANQFKYGVIVSNHGGTTGYCENVQIIGCTVHDTSRDAICLYPGDENGNCRIKNILVRQCEAFNTGQDPDYGAGAGLLIKGYVQDATLEYNYSHNTQGAPAFFNSNETNHFGVGIVNAHLRYNLLTDAGSTGAIRLYSNSSGSDPKDLKIYGNVIFSSSNNGGLRIENDTGNTVSLLIYNNTFYNAPVVILNNAATWTALEFKNNLCYSNGAAPLTDQYGKITAHSNNLFNGTSTLVSSGGTNYSSANLTTWEPSVLSSVPNFKSAVSLPTGFSGVYGSTLAPAPDGLSVLAGSPAIDSGVTLLSPYNSSVNSLARPSGSSFDRGAYEYNAAGPVATPVPPTNLHITGHD
jgi:hypothetical protein